MKIILYKDILNLGDEGDVKVVANGYARNFLLPNKLAVPYTRASEVELAQKMNAITRRKQEKAKAASTLKQQIESMEMKIVAVVGEKGKLFGSVTAVNIQENLATEDINIERKRIELPDGGVKMLGKHVVRIKLYGGEIALLKLMVIPKEQEEEQKLQNQNDEPIKPKEDL